MTQRCGYCPSTTNPPTIRPNRLAAFRVMKEGENGEGFPGGIVSIYFYMCVCTSQSSGIICWPTSTGFLNWVIKQFYLLSFPTFSCDSDNPIKSRGKCLQRAWEWTQFGVISWVTESRVASRGLVGIFTESRRLQLQYVYLNSWSCLTLRKDISYKATSYQVINPWEINERQPSISI